MECQDILDFWFDELSQKQWFMKDLLLDDAISKRFAGLHHKAVLGELSHWREEPKGALAEIIVLDQFSRNMFRDSQKSFQFDCLALALAQEAIRRKDHIALKGDEFDFLMMPFMHSESLLVHQQAAPYFALSSNNGLISFEQKHVNIIKRFNRYPHRNKILGRVSTDQELDFLKDNPGF
ncbi:hypothetical protein A9Q77_01455 [Marinomonas sp. 42_23_T18]|nr:hypothetical protein A9Q77_01455 [Marinomonas sp. 42_23_T18]